MFRNHERWRWPTWDMADIYVGGGEAGGGGRGDGWRCAQLNAGQQVTRPNQNQGELRNAMPYAATASR